MQVPPEDRALRPIDLARLTGLSTQQIRNYADAGVLPPAPRAPSGYRRFDATHREALLAFRALAKGFGIDTARAVMRAVHEGDLPGALALADAAHAALHDERTSLRAAGEALEAIAAGEPDTSALPRATVRIGEVASLLGVRTSALRVWESVGLLRPERDSGTGYRRYRPADVRDARMIRMLRQGHYRLPQIRFILDGLRREGSGEALREAIARRQADLDRRSLAMLEGAARLHHYLDHRGSPRG
ncbi:MerR family transcriptional regulator [Amycolatopsis cynarae]|uniref:MerR family transcriptional regulator n=1 Tax=Amycolatopsis cynarae TaxID=2995223 RepID=A0ABY7AXB2_9PSEU|nr:MerR family transcriptional regulator [Amycolatopsis sp. HUAS 11-8]WAL63263.1 MerR family transcriptional regulator [Amycolatopsis sp. HUAS 11-8]